MKTASFTVDCLRRISACAAVLEAADRLPTSLINPENAFGGPGPAGQNSAVEHATAVRLARLKKIVGAIADGVSARTLKEELLRLEGRQDELRALLAKPEPGPKMVAGARNHRRFPICVAL